MFNFKKKEESPYWGSNGVKGLKDEKTPETKRIVFLSMVIVITLIAIIMCIVKLVQEPEKRNSIETSEIARSMTYDKVNTGEEAVNGTDNVKFDAFFLRDLDSDGYAEGIRGTCKEVGKEDTLYMELNVQTAGVLKDAKITLNGKNFYLQTALPKDQQLKENYISNNTKILEFNEISNGTQKLITGVVRSGDYTYSSGKTQAIGNDINKYSVEDNSVTLTGTYVTDEGEEIAISKTVPFTVDWYGKTRASIYSTYQTQQVEEAIDTEKNTFTMNFDITTSEDLKQLILSKLAVSGTIPSLNGYDATEVRLLNNTDAFSYDEETKEFSMEKQAVTDENGIVTSSISRNNTYKVQVVYPLEAYQSIGATEVSISIPIQAYYEGYNNQNKEFSNPYKSNVVRATIVKYFRNPSETQSNFSVTVGEYINSPYWSNVVKKNKPLRLYNGKSAKETNDVYTVTWRAYVGTTESTDSLILKENVTDSFIKSNGSEESMEGIINYKGIYFGNIKNMLGEDGYIKVYDDETDELLETFDKTNVNKYSSSNPYKYEKLIKKIRIETSSTTKDTSLYIYHVKELDDDAIIEKYEREEFDNLQYIKSELDAHRGNAQVKVSNKARYISSMSIADIELSKDILSTQETERNLKMFIRTQCSEERNLEKWTNGTFLVKLPEEILDVEISDISINNGEVKITNYEVIEQSGNKFIKVTTENDNEADYIITLNLNITPNPREASVTKNIELYASNENANDYYYKEKDIYDVNNNLNTTENINKTTKAITFVAPSSLLTNQIASDYDEKGNTVISPQIAEIKPQIATVDQEMEEKTAKVGVVIRNNYSNTISEITILGKIPFEGNTYTLTGNDLGSQFTTKMTNGGIQLPQQVINVAKVYYSENENTSKDLTDESNGWKTAEQVENWDNIKTYIIDLSSYVMPQGEELIFNYIIKIPNEIDYNKVAYSHHGVYFSLDTTEGKYQTQTQSNKIGFKIAEKYDLQFTKYQVNKYKVVPGATYKITEDGEKEGKTATTDENGVLIFKNLYVEKAYIIEEIKSPLNYELNTDTIKIIGHVENNTLNIEKLQGTVKDDVINVEKKQDENYKVVFKVEDEIKASLKIAKKQRGTDTAIKGARFKITGNGLPANGRIVSTNSKGIIETNGLKINVTYDLAELSVKDYYLADPIKFKIVNNGGNYELQILRGSTREDSITYENDIPVINLTIDDDKIPTYDLEIVKIKKTIDVNVSDKKGENGDSTENVTYLQGAKFNLYKDEKKIGTFETGADGKFIITDLYQYIDKKNEKATYTLKETSAPDGYAKVKDITFKVQAEDGTLKFININNDEAQYTVNNNTVTLTIADSPSFKLIKKDGETGELLANVKFAIYSTDNGQKPATNGKGETLGVKENIDGRDYYVLTTDANGEITADLPEGYYKAIELQAPDKYDISNSVYYFGIGCSSEGKVGLKADWIKKIGERSSDKITSVKQTTDGGYIVAGYFYSVEINLGNGIILKNNNDFYSNGMLIKYNEKGETEWAKYIEGSESVEINSVIEAKNGGYIVGGCLESKTIDLGNGVTISSGGDNNGMIVKYNAEGEAEWAKTIGGKSNNRINSISETTDGGYIVGGEFLSNNISLGNGITLSNARAGTGLIYTNGMLIKYNTELETEWAKAFGGNRYAAIQSAVEVSKGGYIVVGGFSSTILDLGNGVTIKQNHNGDGMMIKYNAKGEAEWANSIGGYLNDIINSVAETTDGGYIVGGYFSSQRLELGNDIKLGGRDDGMMIKYNEKGKVEWAKVIGQCDGDEINSIAETTDGGYIIGGQFKYIRNGETLIINDSNMGTIIKISSVEVANANFLNWKRIAEDSDSKINSIVGTKDEGYIVGGSFYGKSVNLENEIKLKSNGSCNGMIIKYDSRRKIEMAKVIGGNKEDRVKCVKETADGGYIVIGDFNSSTIDLGNGVILKNTGNSDGMIIKYDENLEVEWAKTIGGDEDEQITSITPTIDGGYVLIGSFESQNIDLENGVTLNKNNFESAEMIIKYNSKGEIEWAKTVLGESTYDEINSVVETDDGKYVIGGSFKSNTLDLGNGVVLNNNGNRNGMIIKYNSKGDIEDTKVIGGDQYDNVESIAKTIDGGYIVGGCFESSEINLENGIILNKMEDYNTVGMIIKYNAEGKAEWTRTIGGDTGVFITAVTQTTDEGYIVGGNFSSSNVELGNGVTLSKDDDFESNGMIVKYSAKGKAEWAKRIKANTSYITHIIEKKEGIYIAEGYISANELDLENGIVLKNDDTIGEMIFEISAKMSSTEVQELVIENTRKNFRISTEVQEVEGAKGGTISGEKSLSYETVKYGDSNTKEIKMVPDENYEIVKITSNGEEQEFTVNEDGTYTLPTINNITEDKHIVVTYALKDNKITIKKIDSESKQPLSGARFTIVSESYSTEVETNKQGQAITNIPFGKYTITETQAPEGYELNETPIEIEFTADGSHEFTIENKKLAKIIVHHVIKGTNTKLAEDEIYTGKEGESYTTTPKLDLQGYTLEKDTEGNYIIPENATGTYQAGEQEITYYYVPQKIKLIVHHYIEGTETPVPLNDGTTAKDVIMEGVKGEKYTTQAIDVDNLGENYTLTVAPRNATGTYNGQEIIVTYYYAQRTGRVITHHYIRGTTTPISKDVEQILTVGKTYQTKVAEKILQNFEVSQIPENATGKVVEGDTIVTYYYQPKKYEYTVEYYFEGEKDEALTDKLQAEYGSEISTYKDKVKARYQFYKSENLPLTITSNIETNIIKIYYKKVAYDITTAVDGTGGAISGQGEQPYEFVYAKQNSHKDIVITPDKGYAIKDITINGEKIQYSENEDGTVKLAKFKTVMEDKHVVATFRKLFSIVKQGEKDTILLPGAKFTIKDENGNDILDKNGNEVGKIETINGQEMKVVTTDSDGRIDIDLKPGKYIIVEVQAPENYILPENEADRTYIVKIDKGLEEIRKLKKNWTNYVGKILEVPVGPSPVSLIEPNSLNENNQFETNCMRVSEDKGFILTGSMNAGIIIEAEDTVDNEEIVITNVGIKDGIIVQTNDKGKVNLVIQIKSDNSESFNTIYDAIQIGTNEYMAFGVFTGTITIPAEETTNGRTLTITTNSDSSSYIIKYNSEGKVELLSILENDCDSHWGYIAYSKNDEFMIMRGFKHFEASSENTVTGETITVDAQDEEYGGRIAIKYNLKGKVISAKEQFAGNYIEGMGYYNGIDTVDGGHIQTGSIDNTISIPAEDTTDGNPINIDISTEEENDLGSYGAVLVKFNIDGKVEYLKRIESTDTNIKMLSLGGINIIDEGYLGVVEYYDIKNEETRNALVKFNNNLEIIDMIDIDETKSSDYIQIEQKLDGTYSILNRGTMELSNYESEIVQEAVPPKEALTLIIPNELKKYEYKVEYYYDGKLDETKTEIAEAKYSEIIKEYKDKVKENYVLAKTENLPLTITSEPDKNVIKIYYATKAEAKVQYIDKTTGEIIEENMEHGYVGKEFKTIAKNFKRYVLVQEPEQKKVEMQHEIVILKYYYVQVSSGVIEKHIDINSEEVLANKTYEGLVGDEYETKEKEIGGYDLVKEKYPENAKGTMEEDVITVTYYYVKKVTVTVQYIDIDTNEKLTEDKVIKGHEGDKYTTEKKDIEGYEFVKVTEDENGNMINDKTIIYYYKKVVVQEPEEPEQPDVPSTPDAQEPGKVEDNKNSESSKNTDPTIANTRIPNAGLNKVALALSVVTFGMVIFTYISYRKYKILEKEYGSKK